MRLKQIQVTYNLVLKFFCQDIIHPSIKVIKGIPKDARLQNVEFLDFGRVAAFTFQHDSFDDLPEGSDPLVIACEIQNYGPLSMNLCDLTQEDRQALYVHLHDQFSCRIYK